MADPLEERELVNAALRFAVDPAPTYLTVLDDAVFGGQQEGNSPRRAPAIPNELDRRDPAF